MFIVAKYTRLSIIGGLALLAGFSYFGMVYKRRKITGYWLRTSKLTTPSVHGKHAELTTRDIIYKTRNDRRSYIPVVNEEYKTVFFFFGKCATTEWKRMFVRMMGSPAWCERWIHKKEVNGLKWLDDFSLEEAQRIMTSPEWKRAVFVRNPKDRVLSAFLDKAVEHSDNFVEGVCGLYGHQGHDSQACVDHHLEFDFFVRNITVAQSSNVHWMQLYDQIDEKWWPYINYIGQMEHLAEDTELFLRSIISYKDGISAWERWGTTGWGGQAGNCTSNGAGSFLGRRDTKHETDAHEKLKEYYTPEIELLVENQYSSDFNNSYFHFSPVTLFPH